MRTGINQQQYYVPASYHQQIMRLARERGFKPQQNSGNLEALNKKLSSGAESIDFDDFRQFVAEVQAVTGEPYLGLHMGREVPITANRLLGYAITSSANFAEAFGVAQKYLATLYNFLDYELTAQGDDAAIRVYPVAHLGEQANFMFDMALSFLASLIRSFGQGRGLKRVSFTRPEPEDISVCLACFSCELCFGATQNEILFDQSILHIPSDTRDEVSFQLAIDQCDRELAQVQKQQTTSVQVVTLLKKHFEGALGLEEVAEALRLSPRTVRRRLHQEGTNFQSLQRQVKLDLACDYLLRTTWSISNITDRLGYADVSGFGKAFKEWTGQTPREYRDAHHFLEGDS